MSALTDPTKRRWLGWGSLAVVFLLVNVHRLSTAVLSEQLVDAFAISASQLGTLHASFFFIYAVVQIPTGVVADRYGARYVGAAGAVVLSAGAVAFTFSDSYLTAFLSRAVIGLGSGVIFIATLRFCANWFRVDEFATMTGVTTGIAGLGAILATVPLAVAIDRIGWQPTIRGLAVVGFAAAVAVAALVRRSPSDAGLDPIANVPEQRTASLRETGAHLRTLLGDLDQWLLSVVFFSAMGTILTVIGLWGVPYLVVVYGLDVTTASSFTLAGAVGMLIGAPAMGRVSDRLGRRHGPLIAGLGLFTLVLAVVPAVGDPPLPAVAGVFFLVGFSLGFVMLSLPIIKEQYPAEASGVATATVNGAGFLGGAVLPTAMGVVLDGYRTGDVVSGTVVYTETGYRVAFSLTTAAVATAFCCAVWLSVRRRRRAGTIEDGEASGGDGEISGDEGGNSENNG
ncbi:MFS transporter [Halorubrum salsamenti]|jgi:sugar phosphate permease|uniref:MFS transporter n=1 Tax=Halorubrum salsamenti TaxID=2583990 RepID=UPI0011A849F8|nr:MFS transporter [Halorubrum salsamenti]